MGGDRRAAAAAVLLVLTGSSPARAEPAAGAGPGAAATAAVVVEPALAARTPARVAAAPAASLVAPAASSPAAASPFGPPGSATAPTLGPDPAARVSSLGGPGPLAANGLGSPSCRDPALGAQLSAAARADCAASGVAVAGAPLDNYQFDVHIDAGVLPNGQRLLEDYVLKPVWLALVWMTHVALVGLEWCFSLDLLGSGTLGPVTRGLRSMRDALTAPWLAAVLAIASIALLYNGIARRRVVDTLGQLVLLLAMMIGGLWVIADPQASVGMASRMVNETSLGTLGAAATGDPNHPQRSLDDALGLVFDAAVTGPWCYLEFGNVDWCRKPARLDPSLVASARQIVARDRAEATSAADRRRVQVEADSIGRAKTNGELFLALPANGPRRNSINADPANPSLLRVLCGGDTATSCPSATGPQAEFRTEKGTADRIGGLLLISIGAVGMFALLGFLCLRLLGAALLALLYLLLAPVAVLAPALGDGGRAVFRRWSIRLVGAVLAKLIYSVFLGVALLMVRVLSNLGGLGWWTQWLLIAAFWWLVFNHRHRLLENVIHEREEPTRRPSLASRLVATRQAIKLASPPARALRNAARRGYEQLRRVPPVVVGGPAGRWRRDRPKDRTEMVARTLDRDHAVAVDTVARAPAAELDIAERRARRDGVRKARGEAVAAGDRRRSVSLQRREKDLDGQIDAAERELASARTAVVADEERRRQTGVVHDETQRARRAELLDREAELRPRVAARRDRRRGRRDYAQLAGLAGLGPQEYERLSGAGRRQAQLKMDRELESWRKWSNHAKRAESREESREAQSAPARKPDPRPAPRLASRRERQFAGSSRQIDSPPRRELPTVSPGGGSRHSRPDGTRESRPERSARRAAVKDPARRSRPGR